MIYIPLEMLNLPRGCKKCSENMHSLFQERSICHVLEKVNVEFQKQRPLWCPLRETEGDIYEK